MFRIICWDYKIVKNVRVKIYGRMRLSYLHSLAIKLIAQKHALRDESHEQGLRKRETELDITADLKLWHSAVKRLQSKVGLDPSKAQDLLGHGCCIAMCGAESSPVRAIGHWAGRRSNKGDRSLGGASINPTFKKCNFTSQRAYTAQTDHWAGHQSIKADRPLVGASVNLTFKKLISN